MKGQYYCVRTSKRSLTHLSLPSTVNYALHLRDLAASIWNAERACASGHDIQIRKQESVVGSRPRASFPLSSSHRTSSTLPKPASSHSLPRHAPQRFKTRARCSGKREDSPQPWPLTTSLPTLPKPRSRSLLSGGHAC